MTTVLLSCYKVERGGSNGDDGDDGSLVHGMISEKLFPWLEQVVFFAEDGKIQSICRI